MKVKLRDRHGEHVNESLSLCNHEEYTLGPRDKLIFDSRIGNTVYCQVELVYDKKNEITLIINHLDYLIEKAKLGQE